MMPAIWHDAGDPVEQVMFLYARAAYEFKSPGGEFLLVRPSPAVRNGAATPGVGFDARGCRVRLKWENYRLSLLSRMQCGLPWHPSGMLSLPKPKSRLLSGTCASDLTVSTKTETTGKVTIGATIEAGPVVK